MKTPYIMYHSLEEVQATDTHGQGWQGETVEESIGLCRYRMVEHLFRRHLPKEGRILEAGCGLGNWVFYLRNLGYDVVGIDLAGVAISLVKKYDPAAPVLVDDILATRFPDKHFDAVICLGVLEHFEEGPERGFREIRRVLKDNGMLCVSVPIQNMNRRLVANQLKEFKRWLRMRRGSKYTFEEYRYTPGQFSLLLQAADFEIVECVPDDYVPPRNIGLFIDYPFLRNRGSKWELNPFGNAVRRSLDLLSPWIASGGAFWICRKRG